MHVTLLNSEMTIYPVREAQIASLFAKKITFPTKYNDFVNIFLKESAEVLLKQIDINEHAIKLEEGTQPPYRPTYSLDLVELEIPKTYIETNLANSFIRLSKSPAGAPILFIHKPDSSLRLCVDY